MKNNPYAYLKSGSDIRGVASEGVAGENIELTDETVYKLTSGFCMWLNEECVNLGINKKTVRYRKVATLK